MPEGPKIDAKAILNALLTGAAAEAGKDIYLLIKEFLSSLPMDELLHLVAGTSYQKPAAFIVFELDRLCHAAAASLSRLPPYQRRQLIETARAQSGHDERALVFLLRFALTRG